MKTTDIKNLDLKIYSETLDNGLQIFVIPKNNVNSVYVTFSTKYGSNDIEFIPINKKKMVKVPLGIAHFLEHKLFEQSDGTNPFEFFSERGSDANANTNQTKTTYLFSGPSFVEENINYLLDYVQSPYFTDENVNKEKGIITQEIKMYEDNPDVTLFESLYKNVFINHPMKEPIIGDVKNINKITKEDLYMCYNTFYHPSNMFVVVTGNVDASNIINIIKENQNKKKFEKSNNIRVKKYNEPDKVGLDSDGKKLNVAIPKCAIAYKIKLDNLDNIYEKLLYLLILFDVKYGSTSLFINKLLNDQIINDNLSIDFDTVLNFIIISVSGTSIEPNKLLKLIDSELSNLVIDEKEFERKKKTLLSSLVYMSDNIFSMNHSIMNDIIKYNKVNTNRYNKIKELNFKDFNNLIKTINFSNHSTFIIKPKNKSN